MKNSFKVFYQLAKPGIIYGNIFAFAAGFFLASKAALHLSMFLAAFLGLSFVIASGCVFNNIADRNIDAKMERTKTRGIPSGLVSIRNAVIYGTSLGIIGAAILFFYVNILSFAVAALGWIVYVLVYTPLKPKTSHAALLGSVAGAVPPVVGYAAAVNRLDLGALLLFLILVFWQMPHFYAIAIRRQEEYAAANVPVLPIEKGMRFTKWMILGFTVAFIISAVLLFVYKFAGYIYLALALALGLIWLGMAIQGFRISDQENIVWAKKLFLFSLVILVTLSISLMLQGRF